MKIMLTAFIFFILACQGSTSDPVAQNTDSIKRKTAPIKDTTILGGTWYLQPVLASDTAAGEVPTLDFDMQKTLFTGNTGCNKMRGTFWYSTQDSSLSFSDKFITTKMFCPGYAEKAFITSLNHTNHYMLKNGMLILKADNTELSKWTRKPPVAEKTGKA